MKKGHTLLCTLPQSISLIQALGFLKTKLEYVFVKVLAVTGRSRILPNFSGTKSFLSFNLAEMHVCLFFFANLISILSFFAL